MADLDTFNCVAYNVCARMYTYIRKYSTVFICVLLHSRLCQMVKLYLFAASSGMYSCPLAMTDGAAKILKVSHFVLTPCYMKVYSLLDICLIVLTSLYCTVKNFGGLVPKTCLVVKTLMD